MKRKMLLRDVWNNSTKDTVFILNNEFSSILNDPTTCLLSIFPSASVSTRKCLGAGRQEVKREKTRRRWKIVLEFMVVVASLKNTTDIIS